MLYRCSQNRYMKSRPVGRQGFVELQGGVIAHGS